VVKVKSNQPKLKSAIEETIILSEPIGYYKEEAIKRSRLEIRETYDLHILWRGWICDKCADKHTEGCEDFADYASMSVVNSPRMGICGYESGTIDTERDGVFVLKE